MAAPVPYRPYGAVDLLWRCRKLEVLVDGPAGSGKTRGVLEKVVLALMKYPGARGLISRKIRADMSETVLVTLEEKVLPADWPFFGEVRRNTRSGYRFPNGSELVVAGWDKPGKILSGEYDLIVVHQAEEINEEDWETAVSRLRNNRMPYHQAIAECNPSAPMHWLIQRAERGGIHRIVSRHKDNPVLFDPRTGSRTAEGERYLRDVLGRLTGHRRERLLRGKWVSADGLVYGDYDESIHRRRVRKRWTRFVIGVDDGFTNPLSAHLYCVDGDGRAHSRLEFYESGRLPDAVIGWATRVREKVRRAYSEDVEAVVVDPSAAKLCAEFEAADFSVVPANNAVSDGIRTVAEYLAVAGDGLPRVTFDPGCIAQHREFGAYEWARDASGHAKDVPRKRDDHAMDDLRYALRYLDSTSGNMEINLI